MLITDANLGADLPPHEPAIGIGQTTSLLLIQWRRSVLLRTAIGTAL